MDACVVHMSNFHLPYRLIERHYSTLKPLLIADPKLLPVLMYICPSKQLPFLIRKIPVLVSAAWISNLIDITDDISQSVSSMVLVEENIIHKCNALATEMYCLPRWRYPV